MTLWCFAVLEWVLLGGRERGSIGGAVIRLG
jgi:hypothetical protein